MLNAAYGARSIGGFRHLGKSGTVGASSNVSTVPPTESAVTWLRRLASEGLLVEVVQNASAEDRRALTGAAYEIVWPLVFDRITRKIEQRRGHRVCATGVSHLADDCLDRFHDDVEAVVDDVLRGARSPVQNIEGWIASRLVAVTVDAHRRRRGERGALQRPRLPRWLAAELDGDSWLTQLAVEILEWVGVSATAGSGLWPLEAWSQRRMAIMDDPRAGEPALVAAEVEQVLAAMRRRPQWYVSYVERPLGHKQAPLAKVVPDDPDFQALTADDRSLREDSRLTELAALAVEAIGRRIEAGEEAREVVVDVVEKVFGHSMPTDIDQAPHEVEHSYGLIDLRLADADAVDKIVGSVRDILKTDVGGGTPPSPIAVPTSGDDSVARSRGRPPLCSEETLAFVLAARRRGERLVDICDKLNAAGFKTPGGGMRWYPSHVHRLLQTGYARSAKTS